MARIPDVPGLIYGADYNPEQWSPDVWREDVTLMQEAGVNLVSLGIFSWALLERREGEFDFAWLDEVMDLLHAGGIGVNLATATASPPPWLSTAYPDSRPVTVDGVRLEVGARQLYCPSDPDYRRLAARLASRVAERYAGHPALRLWHVNNEYGCHIDQCFCAQCAGAFRTWLQERYGTLDALNAAWGTAFWSQHYADWAEIQPPRRAPSYPNPTQALDWRRYSSDQILSLYHADVRALRAHDPLTPVTTNYLGFLPGLDYFQWAQHEDVVSMDVYPDPAGTHPHLEAGMVFDLTRSLRGGQRWLLMEQAPNAVNWRDFNAPKRPGLMRLLSHQALAHGADGVMFFQWRQSVAGAEKYHSAMVPHGPREASRVWRESRDLGVELRSLAFLSGARVTGRVGIMFDWNSWWALEQPSKPGALPLMPIVRAWYAALRGLGVMVDFIPPDADLSAYAAVALPQQHLLSAGHAARLRGYVQDGGTIVTGFFSGVVNEHDHIGTGGSPAHLRDVLGVWVEEWLPYPPGTGTHVLFAGEDAPTAVTTWAEVVHATGADVLATFAEDYFAGGPAVTRHTFGAGCAYYVATQLPHEALQGLLRDALHGAGVPTASVPDHVNVTVSDLPDGPVLHLLNAHATASVTVQVPHGTDAVTGAACSDVTLPPYGVAHLRVPATFTLAHLTVTGA